MGQELLPPGEQPTVQRRFPLSTRFFSDGGGHCHRNLKLNIFTLLARSWYPSGSNSPCPIEPRVGTPSPPGEIRHRAALGRCTVAGDPPRLNRAEYLKVVPGSYLLLRRQALRCVLLRFPSLSLQGKVIKYTTECERSLYR